MVNDYKVKLESCGVRGFDSAIDFSLPLHVCRPPGGLGFIDHIVGNQPDDAMVPVSDW